MPEKIDEIFAKSQIPPEKYAEHRLSTYEKDFGHIAEEMIVDALNKKGRIVEIAQLGSEVDDRVGKVDIWIKFQGIEDPLGIQYTISTNEEEIKDKIKTLKENRWMAKKEARNDSAIKYSGNTNVVLVRGDKIKMAHYYEESQRKNVSFSEIIGDPFIGEIFEQIFKQLGEINPIKRDILKKAFERAYRQTRRSKK